MPSPLINAAKERIRSAGIMPCKTDLQEGYEAGIGMKYLNATHGAQSYAASSLVR